MQKLKLFSLIFFVSIFLLGGVSQRHALACEFIEYSDYSEIAPNVFVSPFVNEDESGRLLSIINAGQLRVSNTFGTMISDPIVIVATTKDEASRFGSNSYGKAHLTPIGQCIVLGPEGHNVDVIAHEYTHSEVHFRTGWFSHYLNIPIWFNEGVALLVDFREPYLVDNIDLSQAKIDAVKGKGSDFFSGENVLENYQAARVAVDDLDKSRLYDDLQKIREGKSFKNVFAL